MDDLIVIRQRAYDKITNHITNALSPLLIDKDLTIEMVRSGVIINDTKEMFTIVCNNQTYGSFTVDRNTFTVLQASLYPLAFTKDFGIFKPKDKPTIEEYFKSFIGLCLEPYKKEDQ